MEILNGDIVGDKEGKQDELEEPGILFPYTAELGYSFIGGSTLCLRYNRLSL